MSDLTFHNLGFDGYYTWRRGKPTEINLEKQGLVLIRGPNGAGKSSIFNAMTMVLYGEGADKKSKVTKVTSEGCQGWVEVTKGDIRYRFEQNRSKRGGKFSIYEDGRDVTPKKERLQEVQALVPEIIGLTQREFLTTVYMPQKSVHLLIHSEPKARRDFIASTFGIDVIDDILLTISKRKSETSRDVVDVAAAKARLESLEGELLKLRSHKSLQTELKEVKGLLADLTSKRDSAKSKQREVARKIDQCLRKKKLEKSLGSHTQEEVNQKRKAAKSRLSVVRQSLATLKSHAKLETRRRQIQAELKKLPKKPNRMPDVYLLRNKEAELAAKVKQLKVALTAEGKCDVCLQDVPRSHHKKLQHRYDTLREELVDVREQLDRVEELMEALQMRSDLERMLKSITQDVELPKETVRELEKLQDSLEDKLDRWNEVQRMLDQINQLPRKLDERALVAEESRLEAEYEKLSKKTAKLHEESGRLQRELDLVEEKQEEVEAAKAKVRRLRSVQDEVDVLDGLQAAFADKRVSCLNEAIAAIGERLPYNTATLFTEPNLKFHLACTDRSFSFDVERLRNPAKPDKGTVKYDVATFSGGEEARLSLGLQLTLRDIGGKVKSNLLILDEPDKYLDAVGREGFASKLPELRSQSETVLLTSHGAGFNEGDLYDRVWEVAYEKGTSRLKVVR